MTFDITTRSIVRVFVVLLALLFIFIIRDILILFFLALIAASGLEPVVTWLEKRRIPRLLSTVIIFLAFTFVLTTLLWVLLPPLFQDVQGLAQSFPEYSKLLEEGIRKVGFTEGSIVVRGLEQAATELSKSLGRSVGALPAVLSSFFGGFIAFLSFLLITFYLTLERDGVDRMLKLLTPKTSEAYVLNLWERAQKKIGQWARGQFMLMVLIGLITYAGLVILDVRYPLLLALLAGALEIVPVVGPIVSGAAAALVAVTVSPLLGISTVVFYTVLQQAESNILVPMMFKKTLGLHPIVVIVALLIGAKLGGILGIMLAVPLTAVLTEVFSDFSQGKVKL